MAGTDDGMKIGRLCGKNLLHVLDGVLNDAFYRASPTGMNRSNGIVFGIVEEHRMQSAVDTPMQRLRSRVMMAS